MIFWSFFLCSLALKSKYYFLLISLLASSLGCFCFREAIPTTKTATITAATPPIIAQLIYFFLSLIVRGFYFFFKSVIKGIRNNSVFRKATPINIDPIHFKCSGNGIGSIN
jgi:hypothetical protein